MITLQKASQRTRVPRIFMGVGIGWSDFRGPPPVDCSLLPAREHGAVVGASRRCWCNQPNRSTSHVLLHRYLHVQFYVHWGLVE